MRDRILIFAAIIVVVVVLIILNAATYVSEKQKPDTEVSPNRSRYHSGPTGARAFYDLLTESGYHAMRWREKPDKLLGPTGHGVQTFVVIGRTQLPFAEEEASSLLKWVSDGGRL